jgi:hypothetical protein
MIVDLKLGKFTHADAGQMNLYLNYAREHWTHPYENPPVGLILCSERDAAVAHYALGNLANQVLAREYRLNLPGETEVAARLDTARRLLLGSPRFGAAGDGRRHELYRMREGHPSTDITCHDAAILRVDGEGYDPFVLVLKNLDSGEEKVWPFFWGRDQRQRWRVGQWAPMLEAHEWCTLFDRILEHEITGREYRKGELNLVLRQTEKRFGAIPPPAQERLAGLSIKELEVVGLRLLDATSLEETLGQAPCP